MTLTRLWARSEKYSLYNGVLRPAWKAFQGIMVLKTELKSLNGILVYFLNVCQENCRDLKHPQQFIFTVVRGANQ